MDKIISLLSLGKFWQNVQNCIPTNTSELINDSNFVTTATTESLSGRMDTLETISEQSHTHNNKTLIDSYTQTNANLEDAVSKKNTVMIIRVFLMVSYRQEMVQNF